MSARNHLGSVAVQNVHRKLQIRNPLPPLFLMSNLSSQRRRKRSATRRKTRKREISSLLLNRVRRHLLSTQRMRKTQTSMTLMSSKMMSYLKSLLGSLSSASFRLMGFFPIGGSSSPISTRSG
jgi:hypothetical protein